MRMWKRITIVSFVVCSPDFNVPENGYLTPEYYTGNQMIARNTRFRFCSFHVGWREKSENDNVERKTFSIFISVHRYSEIGKRQTEKVFRYTFSVFHVPTSLRFVFWTKRGNKKWKKVFSFRFLYPFPQEGRCFLYFVLRLPLQIGMKRKMKETELVFRIPDQFRKMGNRKSL